MRHMASGTLIENKLIAFYCFDCGDNMHIITLIVFKELRLTLRKGKAKFLFPVNSWLHSLKAVDNILAKHFMKIG